jgi:soluble lytic murein transglycosylase-like protein
MLRTPKRARRFRRRIATFGTLSLLLCASVWTFGFRQKQKEAPRFESLTIAPYALTTTAVRSVIQPQTDRPTADDADERVIRHIASLVETLQPKKGSPYARSVASHIVRSAHENGVSPYVVSATAVVESELNMKAGPCIGIMQMNPGTVSEVYGHTGKDVYALRDNLWMGSNYLGRHYRSPLASRGGEEDRMRYMWGCYNGAGSDSEYVRRTLRVLHRIRNGTPKSWKQTIRTTGSLWGVRPLKKP